MNITAKTNQINVGSSSTRKGLYNSILNFFSYLSTRGVSEGQKPSETKRIRLTNGIAIFGLVIGLLEMPIYIYLELYVQLSAMLIVEICFACILILSHYTYCTQARILFFIMADFVLFYLVAAVGKESGFYMYYFTVIILPFILFDLKEKVKIIVFTVLAIISVYILEYAGLTFFSDTSITDSVRRSVFSAVLPTSFIAVVFCVYSLVKENSISEKSLTESETLFKGLFDATPDSTIITDDKGFIALCNKQVEIIFGYAASELLGKHISVLIPERLHGQTNKYLGMFAADPKKRTAENSADLFITKQDGAEVAVEISHNSYVAKSGRMIIVVIRDVTERKKYEQELIQFSYVVSHDLKAPLSAIFKLSEWIEEDLAGISENLQKKLQFLRGRVLRLEALINGLLEYSKIGRTNIKKEKVNTHVLIDEVIDLLAPPVHVNIQIQPGMPVFETQKIPLQQVFFNLISNAIKYNNKEKGEIKIGASTKGKFYEFTVEDNGVGIDAVYHEKVFVIFQTLEARDKVEGTGIGLTIVKKSVEDKGGIVRLTSEPGKGTRFTFTWPK